MNTLTVYNRIFPQTFEFYMGLFAYKCQSLRRRPASRLEGTQVHAVAASVNTSPFIASVLHATSRLCVILAIICLCLPCYGASGWAARQIASTESVENPESMSKPTLTPGKAVAVAETDLIEFGLDRARMRIGSDSAAYLEKPRQLRLLRGNLLLELRGPVKQMTISRPRAQFSLKGMGTVIVESTTNGAAKVIPLTGDQKLTLPSGKSRMLTPGNLVFLQPETGEFGPDVHIDLNKLLQSARLFVGFKEPLPSHDAIANEAFYQSEMLEGRSNALIGDARTDEDFQVLIINDNQEN